MAKVRKIVAIGPPEELFYLKSAGVDLVALEPDGNLEEELLKQAADAAVGLIIVSETVAEGREAVIAQARHERGSVVLVVPSLSGTKDTTLTFMKHVLEQSIGVDLISRA